MTASFRLPAGYWGLGLFRQGKHFGWHNVEDLPVITETKTSQPLSLNGGCYDSQDS